MGKIVKIIIGIVVVILIGFLIYRVLPEYPQNFIKSFIQPLTDENAKKRISEIQAVKYNFDTKTAATYKSILESHVSRPIWVYEASEDGQTETVTFYGSAATVNIKDIPNHQDHFYLKDPVKAVFTISGNNFTVELYVNNVLFEEDLKPIAFAQLLNGSN